MNSLRFFLLLCGITFLSKWSLAQSPGTFVSPLDFNNRYIFENISNAQDSTIIPNYQYFLPLENESVLFHHNGFSWYGRSTQIGSPTAITILFRHANPNVQIIPGDAVSHTFTFLKQPHSYTGYKQLIYQDIYPNIDWIVSIHPDSVHAFKYTWRLRPGANINHIQYLSPNAHFSLDADGQALKTIHRSDTLLDQQLFIYNQKNQPVSGRFFTHNHWVGFQISGQYSSIDTLYIDPWVTKIRNFIRLRLKDPKQSENISFELDYDYQNNVYVLGGQSTQRWDTTYRFTGFKTAKYNSNGILQWLFSGDINAPGFPLSNSGSWWLPTILADKTSQKLYQSSPNLQFGAELVRLNQNGGYDNLRYDTISNNYKNADLSFNPNDTNIVALNDCHVSYWGDTTEIWIYRNNSNTKRSSITKEKLPQGKFCYSACQDYSGKSFTIFSVIPYFTDIKEYIYAIKQNYSGYDYRIKHQLDTLYSNYTRYLKVKSDVYSALVGGAANGIAANDNFIFSYDGKKLTAANKKTQTPVSNTFEVPTAYRLYATGLATDPCNHVFVAGDSGNIFCFSFDGSSFTLDTQILVWGKKMPLVLQDIRYNPSTGHLFATGDSFVGSFLTPYRCNDTSLNIKQSPVCGSTLYAVLNHYDTASTYTFQWYDSTTNKEVQSKTIKYRYGDTFSKAEPFHNYKLRIYRNLRIGGYYRDYPFKVFPRFDTTLYVSICEGDSFSYLGNSYASSMTINDTFQNRYGCDSAQQIKLIVLNRSFTRDTLRICKGDSVLVYGKFRNSAGTYRDTLVNYLGCDSIRITQLYLKPDTFININASICLGDSINIANRWRSSSGYGMDTLKRINGCDSIINWSLKINLPSFSKFQAHLCPKDSVLLGGRMYRDSGNFRYSFKTFLGCDSTIEVTVTKSYFNTQIALDSSFKPNILASRNGTGNFEPGKWWWYGDNISNGESPIDSLRDSLQFNWPSDDNWHRMKLLEQDRFGCRDSAEIQYFSPRKSIKFYNVFTPNGDGLNDVLVFNSTGGDFHYSFYVFNRWGEQVFAAENASILDNSKLWNGLMNNQGIECPEGSYFAQLYTNFSHTPQNKSSPNNIKPITFVITLIR